MKRNRLFILTLLALWLMVPRTVLAQTNTLALQCTPTDATVKLYVSDTEPTAAPTGAEATVANAGQWLIIGVTPDEGKWIYKDMITVQLAGSTGDAQVRPRHTIKLPVNPEALSSNAADGTGYYYYQIPAECTPENGYSKVMVEANAIEKIDLSGATMSGNTITTATRADGWSATITLDKLSWTYDGTSHGPAISGFTLSNGTKTFTNTDAQVSISGNSQTNASTTAYNATLSAVATGCLKNSFSKAAFSIGKRDVTLASGSKSRQYNGTALTNDEVEGKNANGLITETGWVSSEGATYEFTGSQTTVGESANVFNYTLKSGTLASNYTITKTEGTLTVTQNATAITVTPSSGSKTYDGTPLTKTALADFTVTGVPEGFTWTATADGTVTNVVPGTGEKAVNAVTSFKIFKDGVDVTDQFSGINTSATGTLTINKKAVTLASGSKSREYNGSALTNDEVDGRNANGLTTETGWVGSEGATYAFTGSQTTVGGSANAFSYTLKSGTVASNYNITKTEGTLTVTANTTAITVTPGSGSKTYDGTPLTKTAHDDFTVTGVPSGYTWTATADGTVTNVVPGTGEKAVNAVTSFKIFKDGVDVTDQFSNIDTSATGTLAITPKDVTLASGSKSREYNGMALTNDEVEGKNANGLTTETGWVGDEGATYEFTGSQTTVGGSANAFSYTLKSGTVASNYSITKTEGTLTVTQNATAITVVPGSGSKTYDGTPLTKTAHDDFTVTGVPSGYTWTATADGTVTNVVPGTGEKRVNAVTEFKIFKDGVDVTNQFSGIDISTTGTLTILAKDISGAVVTANPGSYVFDGSAKKPDASVELDGVSLEKDVDFTITGYENNTAAGTATVTVTGQNNYTGTASGNFVITTAVGGLDFSDITKTYGDADFDVAPNTVESPGAITYTSGNTEVVTVSGNTLTIVGQGKATITATQAASGSYAENTKTFDVTVNRAALNIKANGQTIDLGTAIATGVTMVSANGLKYGDAVSSITLTPSTSDLTNDGAIIPSVAVIKNGEKNVTDNYEINYILGELVIEYAIDLKAGYVTFCSPYDLQLPVTGLQAYTVSTVSEAQGVELQNQTAIGKDIPMVLYVETAGTYKLRKADPQTFSSVQEFVGVTNPAGTDVTTVAGEVFILKSDQFVWTREGLIPQYRCYIVMPNATAARNLAIKSSDTGIWAAEAATAATGAVYDLQGHKVCDTADFDALKAQKRLRKGVYLYLGKKVVVK